MEVFNEHMPQANQLFVRRDDVTVTEEVRRRRGCRTHVLAETVYV